MTYKPKNARCFFVISINDFNFALVINYKNKNTMSEETSTAHSTIKNPDAPMRTREEILAWHDWMRERKAFHQREADEMVAERERRKKKEEAKHIEREQRVKKLMESDYYQIEWV